MKNPLKIGIKGRGGNGIIKNKNNGKEKPLNAKLSSIKMEEIVTKRGYITIKEVESYCNINILDEEEAIEKMELAEEMIDKYVGFQNSYQRYEVTGNATTGTTTTLTDTSNSLLSDNNQFVLSTLQIIAGTNAGEERLIISQEKNKVTVNKAFTNDIDNTSVYRIYQLAKFPRTQDAKIIKNKIYKTIPEQVKRACLSQIEYMIEMGDDFFVSGSDKEKENIDGYSYEVASGTRREIAPKSREHLRGIRNIKGNLIV